VLWRWAGAILRKTSGVWISWVSGIDLSADSAMPGDETLAPRAGGRPFPVTGMGRARAGSCSTLSSNAAQAGGVYGDIGVGRR